MPDLAKGPMRQRYEALTRHLRHVGEPSVILGFGDLECAGVDVELDPRSPGHVAQVGQQPVGDVDQRGRAQAQRYCHPQRIHGPAPSVAACFPAAGTAWFHFKST